MQKNQQTYVAATPQIVCFWSTTTIKVAINKLFLVFIFVALIRIRINVKNLLQQCFVQEQTGASASAVDSISKFLVGLDFSWSRFFQIPIGTVQFRNGDYNGWEMWQVT